ncbi:hypothetical protein ABT324_28215 [Saccharopolyspora sp. NPDC000359]|uniref:hypothetical protein n=1 Tax=Saccharopolyspora sp. NPDC000359 TaxID=3154251 RepID=UPI00332A52D0
MTDNDEHEPDNERAREHLVSTQCRACGTSIDYAGTGRRPQFCSPACRQRAWALRRVAAQLGRPDPMPTVVRDVVERVIEVERTVPVPAHTPRLAADWVPLLEQLDRQMRDNPLALFRSRWNILFQDHPFSC